MFMRNKTNAAIADFQCTGIPTQRLIPKTELPATTKASTKHISPAFANTLLAACCTCQISLCKSILA